MAVLLRILRNNIYKFKQYRFLSSAEVSTALRPFYFSVHPDLFGRYPQQQNVNENSLQQLSALLEAQQSCHSVNVPPLSFYCRKKGFSEGDFRLVQVQLSGNNIRETIKNLLKACDISTDYVDKIPKRKKEKRKEYTFENFNNSDMFDNFVDEMQNQTSKTNENIVTWTKANSVTARQNHQNTLATRTQIELLVSLLQKTYGIKNLNWDKDWNVSHIRGALQSLVHLMNDHSSDLVNNLRGRTVAFGQFTGVSLDGDIFLSIVEVRSYWLEILKNLSEQFAAVEKIPNYEETLSKILRNIHIRRRKFMPKVSAVGYCNHLRTLTTSVGDFYGSGGSFPKDVPDSLSRFEIVIEPEAGPLMLSPTGQFITPSSCPAEELITFIGSHLDEAIVLLTEYSINKHIERALLKEVQERFKLKSIYKDDSVTPALMIQCCQKLLTLCDNLEGLKDNTLFVTNYYSVTSDGVMCVPWNFT